MKGTARCYVRAKLRLTRNSPASAAAAGSHSHTAAGRRGVTAGGVSTVIASLRRFSVAAKVAGTGPRSTSTLGPGCGSERSGATVMRRAVIGAVGVTLYALRALWISSPQIDAREYERHHESEEQTGAHQASPGLGPRLACPGRPRSLAADLRM